MFGFLNNMAEQFVLNKILSSMPKIKVKSGKCRYNYKCHRNAVHDALNKNHEKIAMCFYIDDNQPIIHFINVDEKGRFIDNTIGRWSEQLDYYFIRYIYKNQFFDIDDIFGNYRLQIRNELPLYIRIFSNNEF